MSFVDVRTPESYAIAYSVDLGDVAVRLRLRWLPAISRWTMRVESPGGEPLSADSIAQAGGRVLLDTSSPLCPNGSLRWEGNDTTQADEIGVGLRLAWTPS